MALSAVRLRPGSAVLVRRPVGGRRLEVGMLVVAAVLGAVATTYLAVAGPNVGIHLRGDHLWFFGSSSAPPPSVGRWSAVALNNIALGVFAGAWLLVGLVVRRAKVSARVLLVVGAVWSIPLVIAPPLFSPDAYTYTALGAALNHGVDLYQFGPGAAGPISAVRGAEPSWLNTPSPYGPLFLDLISALSRLLGEHMLQVLVALRLLTLAAVGVLAILLTRLARLHGRGVVRALWLGVLNPLVLLSAVSANHNDTLMMVLLVGTELGADPGDGMGDADPRLLQPRGLGVVPAVASPALRRHRGPARNPTHGGAVGDPAVQHAARRTRNTATTRSPPRRRPVNVGPAYRPHPVLRAPRRHTPTGHTTPDQTQTSGSRGSRSCLTPHPAETRYAPSDVADELCRRNQFTVSIVVPQKLSGTNARTRASTPSCTAKVSA